MAIEALIVWLVIGAIAGWLAGKQASLSAGCETADDT
jgi:uncharacterized membrane protein YeaQ/YmgE (transglycosylase-associated protein family)